MKSSINQIKIFGERNSGTTFLAQLIMKNIKGVNVYAKKDEKETGWKHGFPKVNLFNKLDSTLFIFVIRDLEGWIKSMYFNRYHYKKPKDINEFLTEDLVVKDKDKNHDVYKYESEQQNIVKLRNAKIKSYLDFYENVDNAMIIHLQDLQDNTKTFLTFLKDVYGLDVQEYVPIEKHTKDETIKKPNRDYHLILPKIINKDVEIERFVDGLKVNRIYKSRI